MLNIDIDISIMIKDNEYYNDGIFIPDIDWIISSTSGSVAIHNLFVWNLFREKS